MKLSVLDQSPVAAGATASDALRNTVDLARLADRLGYERYWIAEHHGAELIAATAPEVLIGVVAQATGGIRVGSGAVLLPHYSPFKVAEVFRTLHALFPGRIDLGVGRGPGAGPDEAYALAAGRRSEPLRIEDFPRQIFELKALLDGGFPADHPFGRLRLQPGGEGAPDLWVLGSSAWSSTGAGQLGLPFAHAHFIGPAHTRDALSRYRQAFRPGTRRSRPQALLAVGVLCADSDAEADRLASSLRAVARRTERGVQGRLPSVEDALAELAAGPPPDPEPDQAGGWRRVIVGGPATVHRKLSEMADALGLDEVMALTLCHDHQARRRSYELLAQAFGLETRSG